MLSAAERNIPARQRRGAILIIGMLAVAKRNIITDRVDALLKIGLGPVGKVGIFLHSYAVADYCIQADLMVARHTCVALQRLNGSVKKVKG